MKAFGVVAIGLFAASLAGAAEVSIVRLFDRSTPVPGGEPGETFLFYGDDFVISGEYIAFIGTGSGSTRGVYRAHHGFVEEVATRSTPVPGAPPGFQFGPFNDVAVDGDGRTVFRANVHDETGSLDGRYVYSWQHGVLRPVVDRWTVIPGSGESCFEVVAGWLSTKE